MQQRNFNLRKRIETSLIIGLVIVLSLSIASAFVHKSTDNAPNQLIGKCGSETYTNTFTLIDSYCSLVKKHCVETMTWTLIEKGCEINPFDFDSNLKISLVVFVVGLIGLIFAQIVFIFMSETKAYHYIIIIVCLIMVVLIPLGLTKWMHSRHSLMIYPQASGKLQAFDSNRTRIPDTNFKFSTSVQMAKFYCKVNPTAQYLTFSGMHCSVSVNPDPIFFIVFIVILLVVELVVRFAEPDPYDSGYEEMANMIN